MWKETTRKVNLRIPGRAGMLWGAAIIVMVVILCAALLAFGP